MEQQRKGFARLLFSMLVLATMLSCSLLTTPEPKGASKSPTPAHPLVIVLQVTRPVIYTTQPTATSVSASADNIDVDYTYC